MGVRVVTDSTCDLPGEVAEALGITVVPAYVHFGDKTYRDGIDIAGDEVYKNLVEGRVSVTTSACSPGDFTQAYDESARDSSAIVCITVSGRMSAMYKSALLARESVMDRCRVEVIDSESVSVGLGLIVMAAAEKARAGGTVDEVVDVARQAVHRTHVLAVLDTLKYLLKGGRLSKASFLLEAMVRVKPMITIRNGVIVPAGVVRTRLKAVERLHDFVKKHLPVDNVAVAHNTTPEEAQGLADRIGSIVPGKRSVIGRVGPALGVHAGPAALVVAVTESGRETEAQAVEAKPRRLSLPSLRVPHH
ncbi:MAG: DegV family protein [Chloroflexi bacterium]|nr:DegV family protein [Chloroflexota bacterium]